MTEPERLAVYESDMSNSTVNYSASVDLFEPRYRSYGVNEPVELYKGDLQVRLSREVFDGSGTVTLTWLPRPTVILEANFLLSDEEPQVDIRPGESVQVTLGHSKIAQGSIIRSGLQLLFFQGSELQLAVALDDFQLDSGKPAQTVYFHVANFLRLPEPVELHIYSNSQDWSHTHTFLGRLSLSLSGCKITVDSIYPFDVLELESLQGELSTIDEVGEIQDTSEEIEDIRTRRNNIQLTISSQVGYTLTHCGRVEPASKAIGMREALDLLELLGWFLSLARGSWSFPFLIVGEDEQCIHQWECLGPLRIDPWYEEVSWWPRRRHQGELSQGSEGVQRALEGFNKRWDKQNSRVVLKRAITWYIGACRSDDSGSSMVLSQAALELLAWQYLVVEQSLSPYGFDRLPAEDKIRLLLQWARVPTNIPTQLSSLLKWARGQDGEPDGVACTTQLRNRIVHPPRNARSLDSPAQERAQQEARTLALWYLELVLLNFIEYTSIYYDRVSETDRLVPWAVT